MELCAYAGNVAIQRSRATGLDVTLVMERNTEVLACRYAGMQVYRPTGMQGDSEIGIEGYRAPGGWKDAGMHEYRG